MFCTKCGKPLDADDRFCASCGAPRADAPQTPPSPASAGPAAPAPGATAQAAVPPTSKPSGKGRKLTLPGILVGAGAVAVICAVLVLTGVLGGGKGGSAEGPGFRDAEEAATAYLEALREGDVEAMLSAFAVETYAEHMDLAAYVERLSLYQPTAMPLPGDDACVAAVNAEKRRGTVTNAMAWQYVYLTNGDSPLLEMKPITLEGDAQELVRSLEAPEAMDTLGSLTIGDFLQPETVTEAYANENNLQVIRKLEQIYGADEIVPLAVEVRVDGRAYLFCPNAVCYGGDWYLLDLSGNLAVLLGAASYTGGFVPVDEMI